MEEKPQCPYCLIAEGKIPTNKVYEDQNFFAALEIRPANAGHVILFPKQHFSTLQDMNDGLRNQFLSIAGQIAKAITNVAEGVNILLSSGQVAGQIIEHITINIIPRFKDDKLIFAWNPKQIEEDQMKQLAQAISSALEVKQETQEIKEQPQASFEELEKELPQRKV